MARSPVESFDRFRVEAYTIPQFFADDPSVRVGDSFRPRFDANVGGFSVAHRVHEGDVLEIGWSGEPIEVLSDSIVGTNATSGGSVASRHGHSNRNCWQFPVPIRGQRLANLAPAR